MTAALRRSRMSDGPAAPLRPKPRAAGGARLATAAAAALAEVQGWRLSWTAASRRLWWTCAARLRQR